MENPFWKSSTRMEKQGQSPLGQKDLEKIRRANTQNYGISYADALKIKERERLSKSSKELKMVYDSLLRKSRIIKNDKLAEKLSEFYANRTYMAITSSKGEALFDDEIYKEYHSDQKEIEECHTRILRYNESIATYKKRCEEHNKSLGEIFRRELFFDVDGKYKLDPVLDPIKSDPTESKTPL